MRCWKMCRRPRSAAMRLRATASFARWLEIVGEMRWIAAHALSLGVTLVTNNETDFKVYPGLLVANWVCA